jgi:hypothetical protein
VDVGLGDPKLGEPAWVEGDSFLSFAGIPAVRIPVVPAAQQFAEKIHAYTFPWQDRDNTRVKDLVDLVLLVHSSLLEAAQVRHALQETFRLRATHPLSAELPKPPQAWSESFQALAIELGLLVQDLEQAHTYLSEFWRSHDLGEVKESGGKGEQ